jgi:outer membrane protein assembly factor BamB
MADRHRSTPVVFNGRLIIAQRDGTVSAFSADEESELISEDELNEPTVASPAVANGQIYVRTSKALYSFELK